MSAIIDAIGIIGTILTTIGFASDQIPGSSPNGAIFRVKVGHQESAEQNYGGRIARIMGYDTFNKVIGNAYPGKDISEGDFADYGLDQSTGGIQTQYASFIGTNGAICVNWITLKNTDGAADAAWTGDIGKFCGHSWNFGNQQAGRNKDTGEPYNPACTWLDADHSNGIDTGAMKINFFAYAENLAEQTVDANTACSNTIFAANAAEIDSVPSKKKRSMKDVKRAAWMDKRLLVSNFANDNATELCNHEMSYGPDAVGSDGHFCDMATRELHPLCSSQDVHGCVNIDVQNNKITKRSTVAKRFVDLDYRSYDKLDLISAK
ncbi:hypothetical protein DE146DRAFT_663712 [Phaeosphaeria sp. MPI-PUGE-AT-0046c]|nr:hypothetical protein DE146DRAFT_663712 [Phaeosphaeria sp. MPI-PUGE-AT-0046c]